MSAMQTVFEQLDGGAGATAALLALKVTLVLAVATLVHALLGRASAALRHQVWVAAFAALVALPLLQAGLPRVALPIGLHESVQQAAGRLDTGNAGVLDDAPSPVLAATTAPPAAADTTRAPAGAGGAPAALSRLWRRLPSLRVVLGLCGLVAALLWLRLAVGLLRVRAISRRGRPPASGDGWDVEGAIRESGTARSPRVVVSDEIALPMVWGAVRPTVLMPAAARGWETPDRRAALLHELAHVARGDWPVQLAARLVWAVCWWHPLAWVGLRRLVLEAERASDDRVLAAGVGTFDYADQLVALARTTARPLPAVAMVRRSQLSARVSALLDGSRRRDRGSRRWALGAVAAALVLAALLGPLTPLSRAALPDGSAAQLSAAGHGAGATLRVATAGSPRGERKARAARRGGRPATPSALEHARWAHQQLAARVGEMTPLMATVFRGDTDEVGRLLAAGADADAGVSRLGTPLILAADAGNAEIVRRLLAAGADANLWETGDERPGDLPRSALGAAARSGDLATLRRLLAAGARVDGTPRDDATPLMIAARWGHGEAVRELLDRGAAVNVRVTGDGTPLIEAARSGSREVATMLLDAGADPDLAVDGDGNPLIVAAQGGDREMVALLLAAGADPNVWVEGDESALYHALEHDDREMTKMLIDAGADPRAHWPGDGNPLIVATRTGDGETTRMLLERGADADAAELGDGTPLIAAALRGDLAQVQALVAAGADPNRGVNGDGNPLIAAAKKGHLEIVRFLVEQGAEVDRVVPGDENALIQAAGAGQLEVVRYLLDAGADPNLRVVLGPTSWRPRGETRTPLSMARRGGHRQVVELLLASGAHDD